MNYNEKDYIDSIINNKMFMQFEDGTYKIEDLNVLQHCYCIKNKYCSSGMTNINIVPSGDILKGCCPHVKNRKIANIDECDKIILNEQDVAECGTPNKVCNMLEAMMFAKDKETLLKYFNIWKKIIKETSKR